MAAEIQKRVRDLLYEERQTQKWLAQKCGVTEGAISRIVREESIPGSDLVTSLADAFMVSADYLLGRTLDRTPPDKKDEISYVLGKVYQRLSLHDQMVVLAVISDFLNEEEQQVLVSDFIKRRGVVPFSGKGFTDASKE